MKQVTKIVEILLKNVPCIVSIEIDEQEFNDEGYLYIDFVKVNPKEQSIILLNDEPSEYFVEMFLKNGIYVTSVNFKRSKEVRKGFHLYLVEIEI